MNADKKSFIEKVFLDNRTSDLLERYVQLVLEQQAELNLIGKSTVESIWMRHIYDSYQLTELNLPGAYWVDVGSGAGFPGLVMAIAKQNDSNFAIDLIEKNKKKSSFLKQVVEKLSLQRVNIFDMPLQDYIALNRTPQIVTARAVAPLSNLLSWTHPLLNSGAHAVFLKGRTYELELTEAQKQWKFKYSLLISATNPHSRLIHLFPKVKRIHV